MIWPVASVAVDCDPYWDNVVLAMHLENYTDLKGHTITNGSSEISAVQSKFGGFSAYFDGLFDYFETPSSVDFDCTGDLTWDMWLYPLAYPLGESTILCFDGADSLHAGHRLALQPNGKLYAAFMYTSNPGVNGISAVSTNTLPLNIWSFVQVSISGTTVSLRINGNLEDTSPITEAIKPWVASRKLFVGRYYNNSIPQRYNGFIDDLRITKGIGRNDASAPISAFAEVAC